MSWLKTYKKTVITVAISFVVPFMIFMSIFLHEAWGDSRYVQTAEDIRNQISRLDTQLTVVDQEIIFAESERQKAKFIAIKAIYQREKQALRDKIED